MGIGMKGRERTSRNTVGRAIHKIVSNVATPSKIPSFAKSDCNWKRMLDKQPGELYAVSMGHCIIDEKIERSHFVTEGFSP